MTNSNHTLFLVPIYRETKEEYYAILDSEDKQRREKEIQRMKRFLGKPSLSNEEVDEIGRQQSSFINRMNWRFNRIMGWIEFYSDRRTIKADLWLSKGRIAGKHTRPPIIEHKGILGDVILAHKASNLEIRDAVCRFLANIEQKKYLWGSIKKYYIDNELLVRQIEFLDINKLVRSIEK